VRSDSAESTRLDRQAERDDDAELKAYNAHLSALSGQPGSRTLTLPGPTKPGPTPSEPRRAEPTLPRSGD
jgi:hypothetical protein